MKKRTALKWFTLLEMLIVMIIIWILAVVLTESYISISKVALRIEQQKNISEESLILTQIFQSIADETTIDYDKYGSNLSDEHWYTYPLYLKWRDWTSYKIYTSISDEGWECLNLEWNFEPNEDWSYPDISEKIENAKKCKLILEVTDEDGISETTTLNTSWKVIISNAMFRVVPYNSDDYYFDPENAETDILDKLHQPAFWMFIHLYSPHYQPVWPNKIDQPLQLFFNLKL